MRRSIIVRACASSVVVYLSMCFVTLASAEMILLPGTTLYQPGSGTPNYTVGVVPSEYTYVADSEWTSPITGGLEGSVVSRLYQNTAGEYAFSYQLFNTSTDGHVMTSATIGDDTNPWLGIAISNAGADQSGVSVEDWTDGSPKMIGRDRTSYGEGLRITFFDFNSDSGTMLPAPTGESAVIWVVTDATSYTTTGMGILDSGSSGSAQAYAPIPEPSVFCMLLGGALALGLALLRRQRRG